MDARERRRPRPGGEHDGVGLEVTGRGADVRQTVALADELEHLGALPDLDAVAAQDIGDPGGERVGADVPVLADEEAGETIGASAGSSSCSSRR